MRRTALAIALLLTTTTAASADRTVVLMLFDGFAPAMFDGVPTPALDRMRREGAWTHRMEPVFPSISLINQVTISTGCWPEHHGIVTNVFRDPQRGLYDHSIDADWLTGCEHLHETVKRSGRRSAALWFVGRSSTKRGPLASEISPEISYREYPEDSERAAQVVRLLERPDNERPHFIAAYFGGPDNEGHFQGMDSEAVRKAVADSDAAVGAVIRAIESSPARDDITLVVTTDHGMVPVRTIVNVKKILLNNGIGAEALSTGTTSFLYLEDPSREAEAFAKLSAYEQFDVIRTADPPPYWRLGKGPRVGQLVISAKPPFFIEDIGLWPAWLQWLGTWGPEFMWARMSVKGSHGYTADTPGMAGILYAWGRGVGRGREVDRAAAVDINPTIRRLLDLPPDGADGAAITSLLQ